MSVTSLQRRSWHARKGQRGVALIIVLSSLILLTILVLAFLASISTELKSSKVYANGSSVKLLGESAVNLIMAEIRDATANASQCWASQPGMIRTYDNTGAPVNFYKLYSDSAMVGTGAFDHTSTANGVPANWYSQKGVYVDLNQPVEVTSGGAITYQYPILDGASSASDLITTSAGTVDSTAGVPTGASVLGPLYTDTTTGSNRTMPQVSGFWLNSKTAATYATPVDPSSPNQAPMPVKWLYVLQQGQVLVPDAYVTGQPVTFTGNPVHPSDSNPVVGRMAFWTDDESSKININTASEGSYGNATTSGVTTTFKSSFIDTPRVSTQFDLNMSLAPAWQNEFQRYPGHPATVSLSKVFGSLTTDPNYPENIYSTSSTAPGLAPRTTAGGSKEGSVRSASTTGSALSLQSLRLYATPDEFLLKPTLTGSPLTRILNSTSLASTTELDQNALQRSKFFITATSRAPDVNLFNLPRVSMWPISTANDTNHRTVYDQLIAFCETVGNQIYYFQRSPNTGYQANVGYLSQTEWKDVARNQTLLSYLRTLASTAIPGFGGNFSDKYSKATGTGVALGGSAAASELDQIFMEIFDYIRITNMYDTSLPTGGSGLNQYCQNSTSNTAGGEVVPSYDSTRDIKGFGRFETISKAGLLFIAVGDSSTKQIVKYDGTTFTYGPAIPTGKVRVQAALMFSLFDPAQGFTALYPGCTLKVISCNLTWDYGNLFPNITNIPIEAFFGSYQTQGWSGNLGTNPLRKGMLYSSSLSNLLSPIPISSTDTTNLTDFSSTGSISFGGGDLTVQILKEPTAGTTTGSVVVQTITFTFPSGSFPVPTVAASATSGGTTLSSINFSDLHTPTFLGRLDIDLNTAVGGNKYFFWHATTDTLESVQSVNGDTRLAAARAVISTTSSPKNTDLFDSHPLWGQSTQHFAHGFIENAGVPLWGATRGQLVKNATYWQTPGYGYAPNLPLGFSNNIRNSIDHDAFLYTCEPESFGSIKYPPPTGGGVTSGDTKNIGWTSGNPPGDWDNGIGSTEDGPYINKPDEGLRTDTATYPAYFTGSKYDTSKRVGAAYFSPARQMPSAVMLGSLPTGVIDNRPWQTLLFHPDPTARHVGNAGMKGDGTTLAGAPADHLMLDLFTMPVVEPYAISEPLSTAGRINMNYLMVPFTYINRDTGIRAVLASQEMLAILNTYSPKYKQEINTYTPTFTGASYPSTTLRFGINLPETLKGFQARFFPSTGTPDIFRSPSQICTLPLVPNDTTASPAPTYSTIASYWDTHQLTGDNSRERPYANIYPLLTTKSNTFTVHFRVQTLKQAIGGSSSQWREGTDVVTGEYRGSETIERFVDPGDTTIPDYASNPAATPTLASLYKFRVVSTKQFAP